MNIGVMGAGAFGTALAIVLGADGTPVTLWGRDTGAMDEVQTSRKNAKRLPDCPLPPSITATGDIAQLLRCDVVLLVVPMQQLANALREVSDALDGKPLVACCKGVDLATGLGPSDLVHGTCPSSPVAVLTGPSFAFEIAAGKPTALTLAASDRDVGARLQEQLSRGSLRLYLGTDVRGAELGGALKNVIALAAGFCIGAGFGESARAAVIARGFAEMQRVATAWGADPATLTGLSGLGDLVLTAMSEKSRNLRAGLAIGQGETLPDDMTVEGAATATAVARKAEDLDLSVPIIRTVAAVIAQDLTVKEAADLLLLRPLRAE